MSKKRHEVRVRTPDHAARLVAALIHEEAGFDVRPERDGWWSIKTTVEATEKDPSQLHALAQSTRQPVTP